MEKGQKRLKARGFEHREVLDALGLPFDLVELMRAGDLQYAVQYAMAEVQKMNALLDDWEARNPMAVPFTPWYEAREEWKRAGRPLPPWWEALRGTNLHKVPISSTEISARLLNSNTREYRARQKARKLAQERSGEQ